MVRRLDASGIDLLRKHVGQLGVIGYHSLALGAAVVKIPTEKVPLLYSNKPLRCAAPYLPELVLAGTVAAPIRSIPKRARFTNTYEEAGVVHENWHNLSHPLESQRVAVQPAKLPVSVMIELARQYSRDLGRDLALHTRLALQTASSDTGYARAVSARELQRNRTVGRLFATHFSPGLTPIHGLEIRSQPQITPLARAVGREMRQAENYKQVLGRIDTAGRFLRGHHVQDWLQDAAREFGTSVDDAMGVFNYSPQAALAMAFAKRAATNNLLTGHGLPGAKRKATTPMLRIMPPETSNVTYRTPRPSVRRRIGDSFAFYKTLACALAEDGLVAALSAAGRLAARVELHFNPPNSQPEPPYEHPDFALLADASRPRTPVGYILTLPDTQPKAKPPQTLFSEVDIEHVDTMLLAAFVPTSDNTKRRTVGSFWRERPVDPSASNPSNSSPVWNGGIAIRRTRPMVTTALASQPAKRPEAAINSAGRRLVRYEFVAHGRNQSQTFVGSGPAFYDTIAAWLQSQPGARLLEDKTLPGPPELTRYRQT